MNNKYRFILLTISTIFALSMGFVVYAEHGEIHYTTSLPLPGDEGYEERIVEERELGDDNQQGGDTDNYFGNQPYDSNYWDNARGGGPGGVGTNPSGDTTLPNPIKSQTIPELLDTIVTYLIRIAVPIVTIMIIIGAFQMLFATGDPAKFKKGKDTILFAVIGFAIVLVAKGITAIIKLLLGVS
ncbi:MAG: pilin [bacterium]|nr:pilin [bacterium]